MSKYCPFCGEKLVDRAKFCKSCGKNIENHRKNISQTTSFEIPNAEKNHHILIIVGYLCSVLITPIGIIISLYLLTRKDSAKAKRNGKYILIIALIVSVLSFLLL